ncbi:MAG: M28 family peptidase [Thermoplasmata archaeon]
MLRNSVVLASLAAIAPPTGASGDPDWDALGRRWWSHVEVLADDRMEGRETGSQGYARAADYVIQQFRASGLQPAGTRGFLQSMDFLVRQLDPARSSLEFVRGGKVHTVALGQDACHVVTSATAEQCEAEAVFVGYGLSVPDLNYDDLSGFDLHGKLAVFVSGGPTDMPAAIKAHFSSPEERSNALRRAGAIGLVRILNPTIPELPWPRLVSGLLMPVMELSDSGPEGYRPLSVVINFNPDSAGTLFDGSGHTWQEIAAGLGTKAPLPRFPLAIRIRVRVGFTEGTAKCHNVVGVLPGSDPQLRNEYVVVSAHLDHLGIGTPVNGDPVYHGAIDNASGVASILEIARTIHDSGASPRRSTLFLALTGEEKHLLGSEYFAAHPTVSGPLVANVNIDGVWSNFPMRALEVLGVEESTLGDDIRALAAEAGVEVHPSYDPDRVLFIRSDQYNFIKRGVPALFPGIGYSPGSPEEKLAHEWTLVRYHSPADDAKQPVDSAAVARFIDLQRKLVLKVADSDDRPSWKPESFFSRFAR